MQSKTKLEQLQHYQNLFIWGACIFGILAALCTAGIKIYDTKLKKEEAAIKNKTNTPSSFNESKLTQPVINVAGDYVTGDKKLTSKTKINKKMNEENKNSGNNNGNIGGSGNVVNNNPINITSYNQQGGITAQNVNIGKKQRSINERIKAQLTQEIPSKDTYVDITAVMGDGEAFVFAKEIADYLKSLGYTNVNGVDQVIFGGPVFDQNIVTEGDKIKIIIGNQR